MIDVHRMYHHGGRFFVRVILETERWLYLTRVWPTMDGSRIAAFRLARQLADGDMVTEHFRIRPAAFKPNLMKLTAEGFTAETRYAK